MRAITSKWLKIDHTLQQKCNPKNLVFMPIFAEVIENECIKRCLHYYTCTVYILLYTVQVYGVHVP